MWTKPIVFMACQHGSWRRSATTAAAAAVSAGHKRAQAANDQRAWRSFCASCCGILSESSSSSVNRRDRDEALPRNSEKSSLNGDGRGLEVESLVGQLRGRDLECAQSTAASASSNDFCAAPVENLGRAARADNTWLQEAPNNRGTNDGNESNRRRRKIANSLAPAAWRARPATTTAQAQPQQQQQQRVASETNLSPSWPVGDGADEHERLVVWRAAREHVHKEHYDSSLYGLDLDLDRAVAQHQRAAMQYQQDRLGKEEQAKQVAPGARQSPVALMSSNPAYERVQASSLRIDYPHIVDNLRLSNTGFSWEVKLPYQTSMTTALHGAHLPTQHRFRLDQFHCHWGRRAQPGSEHTVDGRAYTAELHFVHYNMDKYHTLARAARHPDGLVVVAVFVDAQAEHLRHAELEKVCAHLKSIQLKGQQAILRQTIRIENLLPANRSYWSYQGSLTTPPYLESVTWFVLKQPIKCSANQIERFRALKSNVLTRPSLGGSHSSSLSSSAAAQQQASHATDSPVAEDSDRSSADESPDESGRSFYQIQSSQNAATQRAHHNHLRRADEPLKPFRRTDHFGRGQSYDSDRRITL